MTVMPSIAGVGRKLPEERLASLVAAVARALAAGGGLGQRVDHDLGHGWPAAAVNRAEIRVLELAEPLRGVDHDGDDAEAHPVHAGQPELGSGRLADEV